MHQSVETPAPMGARDSGYIAGLKCHDLTSDDSWQCRWYAGVLLSCQNALHTQIKALSTQNFSFLRASSLPHVAEGHMRHRPAQASSMVQHMMSNQTGNKHFVCSLSGSQLMWQIYLYLPGPSGKIWYQNFNSIAWVLYFDFLDDFWL